jgi:hypothetical protein
MCWAGNLTDKKIANKDIHVYKIVRRVEEGDKVTYKAPFNPFYYKLGRMYRSEFGIRSFDSFIEINEGFHSFSEDMLVRMNDVNNIALYNKKNGGMMFCVYIKQTSAITSAFGPCGTPVIMECIIPNGATYYENEFGEIVSNEIILHKDLGTPTNIEKMRIKDLYKENEFEKHPNDRKF